MAEAAGEVKAANLRVGFDPRLEVEFLGSVITSDAGCWRFGNWMTRSD